ncbi:MAG: hypothetical protein J6C00_12060 [Eubacterium sp.]|nr:hypothetical protein [Eubacterium sp.]
MGKITGMQVKAVVDSYTTNNSILETAKATGVSTVKVRKILITEGLWESDTSIKIGELLNEGMTTEEIANTLYMSIKNVQAYMPYERGVYGGEELSKEAIRSDKYRNRMKKAASMQVLKAKDKNMMSGRIVEMEDNKILEFKKAEKEKANVMRLHLELDMTYVDEEEMQILKKYGSVKQTISRDILVPADITLHALHYAILRMFGWQNGHLHNFSLPENVFKKLTENQFLTWSKMAGVYFRFPTENYEDIYWDDDYREGESIKSWMRRKYTGPYKYKGYGEHYLMNQIEVKDMFIRWDEITVHEFDFRAEKQPEPYNVKLKEATIDQVMNAFSDVMCHELIERLPVSDVLSTKDNGEVDFAKLKKYITSQLKNFKVDDAVEEYNSKRFGSLKQEREYLESYNIVVLPVTEQLIYSYDYGDGWKVLITCEDIYHLDENGVWKGENGKVEANIVDALEEIIVKHRPICIEKDGIELVDDVGGIGGFCRMLKTIYEADIYDEEDMEERDSMLAWAEMMGWTGRRISPKQTL